MKVGLYDIDIMPKCKTKYLNIDLMKFGSYYENNGCQVETLTPFDNIFNYDKIVVFSNRNYVPGEIPNFELHPNVDFYGLRYSHFKHVPSYVKEIDYGDYSTKYYNRLFRYFLNNKLLTKEEIIKLKNLEWARIFPAEEPINLSKILTGKKVMLADNTLLQNEKWQEVMTQLRIYNRYMKFLFPQRVETSEQFQEAVKLLSYNFINCRILIDTYNLDNFKKIITENFDQIKEYRTKIDFGFGNDIDNRKEDFYREDFELSLKKVFFLKEMHLNNFRFITFNTSCNILTISFYRALRLWSRDTVNTKKTFNQTFVQVWRREEDIIQKYFVFLNKNPFYYHLLNKKFKREDL